MARSFWEMSINRYFTEGSVSEKNAQEIYNIFLPCIQYMMHYFRPTYYHNIQWQWYFKKTSYLIVFRVWRILLFLH